MLFGEIDELGNMVLCKEYTGGAADFAYSLVYTPEENIVMVGSTTSFGEGDSDILMMEVDT